MDLILELKDKHNAYMKLKKQYDHFLQVRLKARIKLRIYRTEFSGPKKG